MSTTPKRLIYQHSYQRLLTAIAHWCGNNTWPWLKNILISYFVRNYKPDMREAIETNPLAYKNFLDFFTRQLKPEARPIDPNPQALLSPVDGLISQCGAYSNGSLIQAKGHHYSVKDLLAQDETYCKTFDQGQFFTAYLAPTDYHRIHMPCDGKLKAMTYVPGMLFPVKPSSIDEVPSLLARNERLICYFDTPHGPVAVILVAATLVRGMSTVWHGLVNPEYTQATQTWDYSDADIELKAGDELGCFHFGSTVIVLSNNPELQLSTNPEQTVRMGQGLGCFSGDNT